MFVPAVGHAVHRGVVAQAASWHADQAMGHSRDDRAPRAHAPLGSPAVSGGVAVLPGSPVPAGRPLSLAAPPGGHRAPAQPGHAVAPARGPPSTTR
jgi:hypothetical protein